MKTMRWPPTPSGGRIPLVEGAEATRQLVAMTLGDLRANPFNPDGLSLGDVAFRPESVARASVEAALARLGKIIRVESVAEGPLRDDGSKSITVNFIDLETGDVESANG